MTTSSWVTRVHHVTVTSFQTSRPFAELPTFRRCLRLHGILPLPPTAARYTNRCRTRDFTAAIRKAVYQLPALASVPVQSVHRRESTRYTQVLDEVTWFMWTTIQVFLMFCSCIRLYSSYSVASNCLSAVAVSKSVIHQKLLIHCLRIGLRDSNSELFELRDMSSRRSPPSSDVRPPSRCCSSPSSSCTPAPCQRSPSSFHPSDDKRRPDTRPDSGHHLAPGPSAAVTAAVSPSVPVATAAAAAAVAAPPKPKLWSIDDMMSPSTSSSSSSTMKLSPIATCTTRLHASPAEVQFTSGAAERLSVGSSRLPPTPEVYIRSTSGSGSSVESAYNRYFIMHQLNAAAAAAAANSAARQLSQSDAVHSNGFQHHAGHSVSASPGMTSSTPAAAAAAFYPWNFLNRSPSFNLGLQRGPGADPKECARLVSAAGLVTSNGLLQQHPSTSASYSAAAIDRLLHDGQRSMFRIPGGIIVFLQVSFKINIHLMRVFDIRSDIEKSLI